MTDSRATASRSKADARDYVALFIRMCDCAGPQPSAGNSRADEHREDCPYRMEVEGRGDSGE